MLERIAIFLLIINIIIMLFAKLVSPKNENGYAGGVQARPAVLPYDINDFCAYHSHIMLRAFEDGGARFIFDCMLPNSDESIDMIMLAKSGVYVFEHVRANGWITGMENSDMWTERIQAGYGGARQEEKFPNPVRIAESKVHAVREFIGRDGLMVRSVVVFPDFCYLNNIKVFNPNTRVVTLGQLLPAVVTINNKTGTNITQHEINELYDVLADYELLPEDTENEYE